MILARQLLIRQNQQPQLKIRLHLVLIVLMSVITTKPKKLDRRSFKKLKRVLIRN
ncbi:hypothetical protein D3C76_1403210 [compost metagenome]